MRVTVDKSHKGKEWTLRRAGRERGHKVCSQDSPVEGGTEYVQSLEKPGNGGRYGRCDLHPSGGTGSSNSRMEINMGLCRVWDSALRIPDQRATRVWFTVGKLLPC